MKQQADHALAAIRDFLLSSPLDSEIMINLLSNEVKYYSYFKME